MAKKFFAKPTTKTPMTRPSSAPASQRRRKLLPLRLVMPGKGGTKLPKNSRR